jgi:hypothetical protein
MPLVAPWHPAGAEEGWETAKWLSYGPNVLSSSKAHRAGFDDALLLTRPPGASGTAAPIGDAHVLDGPNFAVAWFRFGRFEVPSWRENGMLQSTSATLAMRAAQEMDGEQRC